MVSLLHEVVSLLQEVVSLLHEMVSLLQEMVSLLHEMVSLLHADSVTATDGASTYDVALLLTAGAVAGACSRQ
jgi:hypothetical protein